MYLRSRVTQSAKPMLLRASSRPSALSVLRLGEPEVAFLIRDSWRDAGMSMVLLLSNHAPALGVKLPSLAVFSSWQMNKTFSPGLRIELIRPLNLPSKRRPPAPLTGIA